MPAIARIAPAAEVSEAKVVHFAATEAPTQATLATSRKMDLNADGTAIVAEVAALQQLAGETAGEFSPRQWSAIAEATLHIEAVRQAYEATIARVTRRDRGQYRLEIPAYPQAGDALRAQLHSELQRVLGEASFADVESQLAAVFERRFGGFGVSVQTLEFVASAGAAESDYQVTRTVRFWNAVEGSERLATRRETHFPGLEDPNGHTWGPFLEMLASGATSGAGG